MGIAEYIKVKLPYWPNWINNLILNLNILGAKVYGKGYMNLCKHLNDDILPEKCLCEIVNYAIKNVPYYRKKYGNLKIHSIAEFEDKISFIDKNEVMTHWEDFLVDNIDWSKCIIGTTGGTSGKPLKLVLPRNRYVHNRTFWHKELKWFGWNYETRGVLRNHHLPLNRDYIINPIIKEIIFDAFRIDAKYSKVIWNVLKSKKIQYIHAYPSAFYQFLKFCQLQHLDVSFIKVCFLASEGVTEVQRHFIKDIMGIKIYSFYGHSEALIMAGNCPECDAYHVEPLFGYCELINEQSKVIQENGIIGEMVGTTFSNRYFPLIRYRTGDYSEYANKQRCPIHGNKYKLLNGVKGRWEKNLIHRLDGSTTSTTALNLHGNVYDHIDGLQYVQEEKGKLKVLIIKNEKYIDDDELFIKSHLETAMKSKNSVEIKYVDKLIVQNNGKFLPLISKLND